MKLSTSLALALIAILLPALADTALARDYKLGALDIGNPWSRATPKGADTAAGYLTIKNGGATSDRLIAATLTNASRAQIHQMTMDNGVMRMREVANGIEIKPGETVELKPESFHIMFMGLKAPLVKDQKVKGTLTFEKAGAIDVEFAVEPAGGAPSGQMHGPMQMDHMH
jgi:periplasmic copper chaperone A